MACHPIHDSALVQDVAIYLALGHTAGGPAGDNDPEARPRDVRSWHQA
jgi:hypothetical protein